ncbi:MAG TPA: hypothetical protein VFH63_05610 [candidate division Zixibacteria bacterium]|nr:hypothetical protein [candidate division Zixibacteria bacterium]
MDPALRRVAERRLVQALRRLHRREPLRSEVRLDAVLEEARAMPPARSPRHRGSARLVAGDAELLEVLDGLIAGGKVVRRGRRVRLPDHEPTLSPTMRARVDRLLDGLRAAGTVPPRADGIAARLGVPPPVLQALRDSGELVSVAPGIDYPRDVWERLSARLEALAASGPLTVARVRDDLRSTRRHAEALLAQHRARRRARRRGGGAGESRGVRSRRRGG